MDPPGKHPLSDSSGGPLMARFGLDAGDDHWIQRLCAAEAPASLGVIGAYELIAEVGHGTQGVVWRARQPGTKRDVAIKRMLAGALATATMRRQFEREVEAASTLNHPNIVTVYGMELIDDQPLLAMEWVDGVPVTEWAAGTAGVRRGVEETLKLFLTICDAIQHAHQRGVIHRDLKPANILIDAAAQPRVLDFGLAKRIAEAPGAALSTATGHFVGTPAYAAPEQARGAAEAIDVRSDVYALGVILYEMLTGRRPHDGTSGLAELLQAIQHVEPPRPSAVDARITRELETVILKALTKDPLARYQSVDALAADLRRYLAGQPILAHPPSTLYHLRKAVRRHRLAFVLGCLAIAALVAGFLYANASRRAAVLAGEESERRRQQAEAVSSLLMEVFSTTDPLETPDRGTTVRQMLETWSVRASEFDGQPAFQAALHETVGNAYRNIGLYAQAEQHLRLALERRRALGDEPVTGVVRTLNGLGSALYAEGRYPEAESMFREALALGEQSPEGAGELAVSFNNLAQVRQAQGDLEGAEPLLRDTLELRRRAQPRNDRLLAGAMNNLAALRSARKQHDAAESLLREALALQRQRFGGDHLEIGGLLNNLSEVLRAKGEYEAAETVCREALAMRRRVLGERHHYVGQSLNNLGTILYFRGDYEGAEKTLGEALAVEREVLQENHPATAQTLCNLAQVFKKFKRYDEAAAALREAVAMRTAVFGAEHPLVVATSADLEALERQAAEAIAP